jgi:hypothetical protein
MGNMDRSRVSRSAVLAAFWFASLERRDELVG